MTDSILLPQVSVLQPFQTVKKHGMLHRARATDLFSKQRKPSKSAREPMQRASEKRRGALRHQNRGDSLQHVLAIYNDISSMVFRTSYGRRGSNGASGTQSGTS